MVDTITNIPAQAVEDVIVTGVSFVPLVGGAAASGISVYEATTGRTLAGHQMDDLDRTEAVVTASASLVPGGRAAILAERAAKAALKETGREVAREV